MKELKFRAWDGDNMRYDITWFEHWRRSNNSMEWIFIKWEYYQIKTTPVMQYTWLKDKNWIEIYDDDIIQFNWYWVDYKWCIKYGLYDIYTNWWKSFIWENIWRYISDKNWKILIDDTQETILLTYRLTPTVIWNIYENANLLTN